MRPGVEDDDDLRAFLDTDEHAITVLVGDDEAELTGILRRTYIPSGEFAGNRPVFHCIESDARALNVADGVALVNDEDEYVIRVPQPDGTGMIDLVLEGPL